MLSTCTVVGLRGISGGSHKCRTQILVCDGNQQQEEGPSFGECEEFKLCKSVGNVPTSIFTE